MIFHPGHSAKGFTMGNTRNHGYSNILMIIFNKQLRNVVGCKWFCNASVPYFNLHYKKGHFVHVLVPGMKKEGENLNGSTATSGRFLQYHGSK